MVLRRRSEQGVTEQFSKAKEFDNPLVSGPDSKAKEYAKKLHGDNSDDAMTIIAGLLLKKRSGDAARVALVWLVTFFVQIMLILSIGAHAWRMWNDENPESETYINPSCNSTETPEKNECQDDWIARTGFYFAVGSFGWYILQDQYSTTVPSLLALTSVAQMGRFHTFRWRVMVIVDAGVTWAIFVIGVAWLSMTQSIEDIVLNCTALIFIAEVDDACIKIGKKIGLGRKLFSQSAAAPVFAILDARIKTNNRNNRKYDSEWYIAWGYLILSVALPVCSLPISAFFGLLCLVYCGKQVPTEVDWIVLGSILGVNACVACIFAIDVSGKENPLDDGPGAIFQNPTDAEDIDTDSESDDIDTRPMLDEDIDSDAESQPVTEDLSRQS